MSVRTESAKARAGGAGPLTTPSDQRADAPRSPSDVPGPPRRDDALRLGSHTLTSRLIVGTGKYANYQLMAESLEASGTECITVAVRRERLIDAAGNNLLDFIDTHRYIL